MFVVALEGLAVAGHGLVVDGDLFFQYRPAFGHGRKHVGQGLDDVADNRRRRAVLLQLAVGIVVDVLVNELAQVVEDTQPQFFQVVQPGLQVIKGRHGDPLPAVAVSLTWRF